VSGGLSTERGSKSSVRVATVVGFQTGCWRGGSVWDVVGCWGT
jgi:hypothetical protein